MKVSRRDAVLGGAAAASLNALFPRPALAQTPAVAIGLPFELGGRFVAFGQAGVSGARLAIETFQSRAGSIPIEPVYRDVQSDTASATSVMTELCSSQNIRFMVGPLASVLVSASIPVWQRNKNLWVCPGGTTPRIEEEIGKEPLFFHTFAYSYNYHQTAAEGLSYLAKGGQKRLAVLYVDDSYGRSQLPYVEQYYTKAGFEIVAKELVRANTVDMGPALSKIALLKPDLLLALVQTSDAITMAKQVYTRRMNIPYLLGTAFTELEEWQKAVGEAQEGWMGIASFIPGMSRPANPDYPEAFPALGDWVDRFRNRFKTEPTSLAVATYTSVAILLIAIERAKSGDMEEVAAQLRKMDMPTINGQARFAPTPFGTVNQAFDKLLVFQRRQGKDVIVYPPEIATGTLVPATRT